MLHIAQVLELGDAAPQKIGWREVETATAIVDQLHQETCLFHDRAESDELLLMRHVHALAPQVGAAERGRAKHRRSFVCCPVRRHVVVLVVVVVVQHPHVEAVTS